jgi:WD40 repeat protein
VKDASYEIREARSGKLIWTIKAHSTSDKRVASPDGSMIAERGSYGDACVKIFDASSNELIRRLEGHPGIVDALAFSPDGKIIASGGGDNVIRFWNAQTGVVTRTLSGHTRKITSLAFSGDGTKLISGSKDDTVKIWNVDDGRLLRSITGYNSDIDGVETVALSNDGQTAIGSGGVEIKVWDALSGKQIRSLTSGKSEARSLMFSRDNKLIVSAHADNTVKLWDGTKARLLRVIKGRFEDLRVAVFSPDGNFIATGYNSDSRVELWSVRSGKLIRRLGEDSDYVRSLSFSRDGSMIVTGHLMSDINVWSTRTGKLIKSFKQTYSQDDHVAFSPDGKHIVSGGKNQNILLWNVQNGSLTWSAIPIDWETEKKADEEAQKEHAIESALEAERKQKIEAADKEISTWGHAVSNTYDHYGEALNPLEQHMGETGKANKSLITKSAADADGVWLRLRNNSSLPISFRTDSSYFSQSGCTGLCDGAEVSIQYGIEEANGKPVPWGLDMSFRSVLPPGASVLFSVNKMHLQNRRTVFVSYSYLKENEKKQLDEYGTSRRVSFSRKGAKIHAKSQRRSF